MIKDEGFTLIEVIIAIVILSISFVMMMQLFSGGLRAAWTSCDYSRAIVLAKDKMEELSDNPVQDSGDFEDGFKWESEVDSYRENEETALNLLRLKVKVSWQGGVDRQRSVELVSLKAVMDEEKR
jgi:general secretion pathway protein I